MTDSRDQTAFVIDRATLEAEVRRIVDAAAMRGYRSGSLGRSPSPSTVLTLRPAAELRADLCGHRPRDVSARTPRPWAGSSPPWATRTIAKSISGQRVLDRSSTTRPDASTLTSSTIDSSSVTSSRSPAASRRTRPTIPLAELLLSKLQIVKINEKDVVDAILLLLDHPLGVGDADTIDVDRIAALAARSGACGGRSP